MKAFTYSLVLAMAIGFAGCVDLTVENENNPNRLLALATPQDVETLAGNLLRDYFWATQDCEMAFLLSTMADEISSSWANWGMRDLSSEPRITFNNSPAYSRATAAESAWFRSYITISNANDVLIAIAAAEAAGSVNNGLWSGVDVNRARTFAKFMQGLAHAWIALYYDQGFIVDESVDLNAVAEGTVTLEFSPYGEVMNAAIGFIDESISLAQANSFEISAGDDWFFGNAVSNTKLVQLANSYVARSLAQVARDPAERAAVNWAEVINRINNGITEDFLVTLDENGAQPGEYNCMWDHPQNGTTWSRIDYRTLGPADVSGGFQAWQATPLQDRLVFNVVTPDRRINGSADDPTVDGSDFEYQGNNGPFPPARGTYHYSSHNHKRYQEVRVAGDNGTGPWMKLTEMDMLKAEALLRTGGSAEDVAALINKTRVDRGQMNPATAGNPAGSPGDAQSIADDASLWALLKHEKRIETIATASGLAFFDDRGWGELVSQTLIHFPVPGKELQTLDLQTYTFGGGGPGSAPRMLRERADIWDTHAPK